MTIWRRLRKLLDLDLSVIYPAHGPAIREPYKKLNDYITHRELREQQVLDALNARPHQNSRHGKTHLC